MIDQAVITTQLRRLSEVYAPPKHSNEDAMRSAWHEVLREFDEFDFIGAISDYLNSDASYFPKPGMIRRAIMNKAGPGDYQSTGTEDWNQRQDGPCPVCGATLRYLTAHEQGIEGVWENRHMLPLSKAQFNPPDRLGVLHDQVQHERANIPAIGLVR